MQDPTRHREASDATDAQPFISRWRAAGGSERANCQLFVTELCALLGLPAPEPAREDVRDNAYVFERRVGFAHGDGSTSSGFIDCYRRGAFVLEAKKLRAGAHTKGFDDALLRARAQAEGYARALPAAEGRPPFLVVVDVGHVIELYAEFTRSGATYTPFPDARSHRIALAELQQPEVRERPFTALDEATLFPPPETVLEHLDMPSSLDFHSYPDDWDSHRHEGVIDMLRRAQRWALRRLRGGPITLLGKQVFVAPDAGNVISKSGVIRSFPHRCCAIAGQIVTGRSLIQREAVF